MLKLLGVEEQAKKRAALLSGGQQQRVAIARSLIIDPNIIMGDEPTGNLDSSNTEVVLDLFKKIAAERGQTFLIVPMNSDFASKSDRIIHLEDGQIMETW